MKRSATLLVARPPGVRQSMAILFAVLCVMSPSAARGAGVVGTGTAASCTAAALDAALAGGALVTFNCGSAPVTIGFDTPISVNTAATIDGGGQITLSGKNSTTLFLIQYEAALTLTHLTVTKGFANADGGAVRVASGGSLVVDSCTFSDNHAGDAWSGGAILTRGTLRISNSTFDHNSAGNGGALNPRDGSSSTDIRNTLFSSNSTTNATNGWGGAMLVWVGAAVTVEDSQFVDNTASSGSFTSSTIDRGGAVYVTSTSSLAVTTSEFAGNAAFFGGALYVDPGATLTVRGSNLHDNTIGIFDGTQGGGAIYNLGEVLVDNTQLHDNHADGSGGAIDNVYSGSLRLQHSVLRHNFAEGGGAIANSGDGTVLMSTLADNIAQLYGGAINAADETDTTKTLTITSSTLSGNSAGSYGGAIESEMGLTLINVTVSGNTGPQTIDHYGRPLALTCVTLAQNTGTGLSLHNNAPLELRNTLLAHGVTSGPASANCARTVPSLGYNLDSDGTCGLSSPDDLSNIDPGLGSLQDNGGPTFTHALLPGSPAIDAGDDAVTKPPLSLTIDQRGRPRLSGTHADIGAYEAQPDLTPTATATPTTADTPTVTPTAANMPTRTSEPTNTATQVVTATATSTPTPTLTVVLTPAATPTATSVPTSTSIPCVGDCDRVHTVAVNNIITLVNIALGTAPPAACADGIPAGSSVDVALIVQAVNNALNGCP